LSPHALGLAFAGLTALSWTFSAAAFSSSSRMVGSLPVNVIRLVIALVFFTLYGGIMRGQALPLDASAHAWFYLSLSGFVGFFLGDLFYFRAFVELGVRLAMVAMSLAPVAAAVAGWFWLGERITPQQMGGMAVTLLGVAWVVMERRTDTAGNRLRISVRGVLFAVLGAAGQGLGAVLSKEGMIMQSGLGMFEVAPVVADAGPMYDSFAATQIRALTGLAAFVALVLLLRRTGGVLAAVRRPKALGIISFGAFFGPFLGVAFLLRSFQTIPTGIAHTIVATVPVLIIPVAIVTEKERVTWRALVGAIVAVAGVAMLCL
jgi:drug/metabolite transporter (DMT)-like permease